jgi:photosystem II stability/assembly factor-like uncharacterized protein/DNA-binding CsgD family transcriptional regulator
MGQRGRPKHPDLLTPREHDVLALLRDNLTNEQIADRLGISFETAKHHVGEILSKLGVATREEAAAWRPAERQWSIGRIAIVIAGAAVVAAAVFVLSGLVLLAILLLQGGDEQAVLETSTSSPSATNQTTAPTAVRAQGNSLRDIQTGLFSLRVGSFINASTGWLIAGGSVPTLLKTTDGGGHWVRLHKFEGIVANMDFADQQNGWVATYDGIEQTQDGGESWTKLSMTITNPRSTTGADDYELKGAQHIDFVDSLHGWVAGTDELFRTADGGSTWTVISVPCPPDPNKGFTYTGALSFIDTQKGWVGCFSPVTDKDWPLFKTTDGGDTWQTLPRTSFGANHLAFVDQTTGWAGTSGHLYATSDGGQTWTPASIGSGQDIVTPMPATAQLCMRSTDRARSRPAPTGH